MPSREVATILKGAINTVISQYVDTKVIAK